MPKSTAERQRERAQWKILTGQLTRRGTCTSLKTNAPAINVKSSHPWWWDLRQFRFYRDRFESQQF
jgi:hypothetical protein